jgi:hypothetical protein
MDWDAGIPEDLIDHLADGGLMPPVSGLSLESDNDGEETLVIEVAASLTVEQADRINQIVAPRRYRVRDADPGHEVLYR